MIEAGNDNYAMLAMIPNLGDHELPDSAGLKEPDVRAFGRITFGKKPCELTGQQRVIKKRRNAKRRKNWTKKKARARCAATPLDVPEDEGENESEAEVEDQPMGAPEDDDA